MSRAEEIIVKHIKVLECQRDKELEFQKESDDRWKEYTDRRFELLTVLAEIRDCDIVELVLE